MVLFDLAVRFRFAPAPRALVVEGAGSGVWRIIEANVREPCGHPCSPLLHGPPEASSSGQQGAGDGEPTSDNPRGRGLRAFDVIN